MRNLDKKGALGSENSNQSAKREAKQIVRPEMPECVGSQLMKLHNGDEI